MQKIVLIILLDSGHLLAQEGKEDIYSGRQACYLIQNVLCPGEIYKTSGEQSKKITRMSSQEQPERDIAIS